MAERPDRRVLIVDDSAFMRASLRHIVSGMPGFIVAGDAVDGEDALEKAAALRPDVITMDIDMPKMNGIDALRRLRVRANQPPAVIMVSAFTTEGAALTLTALQAGAIDFVPKASEHFSVDLAQVGDMLREKLNAAAASLDGPGTRVPEATLRPRAAEAALPPVAAATPKAGAALRKFGLPDVVVVASSTGGPQTLPKLLAEMPGYPAPVVIAQHMPPLFSRSLALSMSESLDAKVVEAEDGQELAPGVVYVLPGGRNGEIIRPRPGAFAIRLSDGRDAVYRPNANVLFRSAALNARRPVGVVLTGMGNDGCEGAIALRQRGRPVFAQDPASAVIWGMPQAVINAGAAVEVLDAAGIGRRLNAMAHPHEEA